MLEVIWNEGFYVNILQILILFKIEIVHKSTQRNIKKIINFKIAYPSPNTTQ